MNNFMENRYKIAKIIAAVSSVLGVISLLNFVGIIPSNDVVSILGGIGVILALAAYVCGGFGQALKSAAGIAKWGWVVTPFPIDIFTFLICAVAALLFLLFLPIIPVMKAAKEHANQ